MQYALVTGAAKGIGAAIAKQLARRQYRLLLTDIDATGLQQTADAITRDTRTKVETFVQDLADPFAVEHLYDWTYPYHTYLNVIVNNAGFGLNASFEQLDIDEQFGIIDVNIKAQLSITHRYLPVLRNKSDAYLLNVCSTTAYQPVPYLAMYAASKAFVLSFNRSLQHELRKTTVSLSILSPGATDTDFVVRARMKPHTLKTAKRFNMTADEVAVIAVRGLFNRKAEIVPGFSNKLNAWLPKFFPVGFVRSIAGSIYAPREQAPAIKRVQAAHHT